MENKRKRDTFISLTRKAATKEIRRREALLGRKLTKIEAHDVIHQKAKGAKLRLVSLIVASSIGLGAGVGIGIGGTKMLNPGMERIDENKNEITVDIDSADKDIAINNVNTDRDLFINGLKVDITQPYMTEDLENNVRQEVEQLITQQNQQSKEEQEEQNLILDYLKGIYAEEYNKIHNTNIGVEDIKFYKQQYGIQIYQDENGTHRISYNKDNYHDNLDGTCISVENNNKNEKITNYYNTNKYYKLYSEGEEVTTDDTNVLLRIAEIVDTGIDLSSATSPSHSDHETFKERFIKALVEYRQGKISEIVSGNTEVEQDRDR